MALKATRRQHRAASTVLLLTDMLKTLNQTAGINMFKRLGSFRRKSPKHV